MMTRSSDYVYMTPDSGDITGDIIPAADINGAAPTMRKENLYYLLEMFYDLQRRTTSVTGTVDSRFNYYKFNDIATLFERWSTAAGVAQYQDAAGYYTSIRFKSLPSAGLEYVITNTDTTSRTEFFTWIAQNYPQYILTMPQIAADLGTYKAMKVDTLRKMFWGFNQPCYESFYGAAVPTKYRYSVPTGQTLTFKDFSYDSLNDTLTTTDVVRYFVLSSGSGAVSLRASQDSGSYLSSVGQFDIIEKYVNSVRNYKRLNGFPQSDVYCTVNFDSSMVIEDAFILTSHYFCCSDTLQAKKLLILEPMERISDTQFRFKFFRPSIMKRLTDELGIPWEGDSDFSTTRGHYGYGEVWCDGHIWAKIGNKYTALPAGWDWSPS